MGSYAQQQGAAYARLIRIDYKSCMKSSRGETEINLDGATPAANATGIRACAGGVLWLTQEVVIVISGPLLHVNNMVLSMAQMMQCKDRSVTRRIIR